MSRALAIVNPVAGRGRGRRALAAVRAAFAPLAQLEVAETAGPADATRLARQAVGEGYALVVAVGGDGTASEVAAGLVHSTTTLGLYPIGIGNDFARALGYPRDAAALARGLRAARPRKIDVGELNGRLFLNAAGVGIDGHVAERIRASARVLGRRLGYLAGALASIATYRPQPMRVTFDDGAVIEGRQLIVAAANGTHFGGGMHLAPGARIDDGLLEIIIGGDLGRLASVAALARLYRGTHVNGSTIVRRQARSLAIALEHPLPIERDGEVDHATELRLRVIPLALPVLGV